MREEPIERSQAGGEVWEIMVLRYIGKEANKEYLILWPICPRVTQAEGTGEPQQGLQEPEEAKEQSQERNV